MFFLNIGGRAISKHSGEIGRAQGTRAGKAQQVARRAALGGEARPAGADRSPRAHAPAPAPAWQALATWLAPAAAALLLAYRITVGVDLSDESYYLSFVDGWLKTGIQASKAAVLHQTAALPVYPFAKAYAAVRGDTEGLALLLRALYGLSACAAGWCFGALARATHGRVVGAFAFVLAVSFVPFSLPAPSYNTLGAFGLLAALSTWGLYWRTPAHAWAGASALAWVVATVAYPTLLAVLATLLFGWALARAPRHGALLRRYAAWCLALQVLGLALVLAVYGAGRLGEILAFTNASLRVSDGLADKLARAARMVAGTPGFAALCAASVAIGAARARAADTAAADWLLAMAVAAVLAGAWTVGPVLYARTHDYVFLLGLMGAGFVPVRLAARRARPDAAALASLSLGLAAGAITSLTATNGLVNFAVGGFCGAALFLLAAMPAAGRASATALAATLGMVACFFLQGAFAFVYGEQRDVFAADARRIRTGVFAGLLTTGEKAAAIEATTRFLAGLPGDSVAVLGRLPGIYLLTDKHPRVLSTWDFGQQNGPLPRVEEATIRFQSAAANQPALVLAVSDPWTRPPAAAGQALLAGYRPIARLALPGAWSIEAYGR